MNILKLAALGALAGGVKAAETGSEDIRNLTFVNPDVCKIPDMSYSEGIATGHLKNSACTNAIKPDWTTRGDIYSFVDNGYQNCLTGGVSDEEYCKIMKGLSINSAEDMANTYDRMTSNYFSRGQFDDSDIISEAVDRAYAGCASDKDSEKMCRMIIDMAKDYYSSILRLSAQKMSDWSSIEQYVMPKDNESINGKTADELFDKLCDEIEELAQPLSDREKLDLKDNFNKSIENCSKVLQSYYGESSAAADEICKYTLYYIKNGGEYILANLKNYLAGLKVTETVEKAPAWSIAIAAIGAVVGVGGVVGGALCARKGKRKSSGAAPCNALITPTDQMIASVDASEMYGREKANLETLERTVNGNGVNKKSRANVRKDNNSQYAEDVKFYLD